MTEPTDRDERSEQETCTSCGATRTVHSYADGTFGVAGPGHKCADGHPHRFGSPYRAGGVEAWV